MAFVSVVYIHSFQMLHALYFQFCPNFSWFGKHGVEKDARQVLRSWIKSSFLYAYRCSSKLSHFIDIQYNFDYLCC